MNSKRNRLDELAIKYVTIKKFSELSGYSPDAIRAKIKRGDWLKDIVWLKAPDERILINIEGYESWVERNPPKRV